MMLEIESLANAVMHFLQPWYRACFFQMGKPELKKRNIDKTIRV